jgi:hypothetical protein
MDDRRSVKALDLDAAWPSKADRCPAWLNVREVPDERGAFSAVLPNGG